MTAPIEPHQLRVSVELGEAYEPTPRLRAALVELGAALAELDEAHDGDDDDDEVAGFMLGGFDILGTRSLSFDTLGRSGPAFGRGVKGEVTMADGPWTPPPPPPPPPPKV